MKKLILVLTAASLCALTPLPAFAEPLDDGIAAYEAGDYKSAVKFYKQAIKKGNRGFGTINKVRAETYLGEMYLNGQGVKQSNEKAYKHLKYASNRDAHASYLMAQGYERGDWHKKDLEAAKRYYIISAKMENDEAMYALGVLYENTDMNEAIHWYKKSVKAGNIYAQQKINYFRPESTLSDPYERGLADVKSENYEAAVKAFREAANTGNMAAKFELAMLYQQGKGVQQSDLEAALLFLELARTGNTQAQYNIGIMYENGGGIRKNPKEAMMWFQKAANQDHVKAQLKVGTYYEQGSVVPESFETAAKWYRKSADQGLAEGQWRLALMYQKGWGVQKSRKKEIYWMQQAANQGHSDAKWSLQYKKKNGYDLTNSYVTPADTTSQGYYNDGVRAVNTGNKSQAVNSFRIAADQGHAPSQAELGAAYMHGYGLEENFYKSRNWLEKAAAQGDADGYFLLGNIYYNGLGVAKDEKKALKWYRKAAAKGHADGIKAVDALTYEEPWSLDMVDSEQIEKARSYCYGRGQSIVSKDVYLGKSRSAYSDDDGYYFFTGSSKVFVSCGEFWPWYRNRLYGK